MPRARFAGHAVVVQEQNPGLPARGYGCDSRPPLRSNEGGTTLVIAKAREGSMPSAPSGVWSLRVSSTSISAANVMRTTSHLEGGASGHRVLILLSPLFSSFIRAAEWSSGELAWLITKRSPVRVRPPQPLCSWEDARPHKPARDGSSPSTATKFRSGLKVGRATLNRCGEGSSPSSGAHLGVAQSG
jgi:hypothetical protein